MLPEKSKERKNLILSREQLKTFDGHNGQKVYIAYKGKVYDVSESLWWIEGIHQGEHLAGKDLTEELEAAPHGEHVFERLKMVAELKKE